MASVRPELARCEGMQAVSLSNDYPASDDGLPAFSAHLPYAQTRAEVMLASPAPPAESANTTITGDPDLEKLPVGQCTATAIENAFAFLVSDWVRDFGVRGQTDG